MGTVDLIDRVIGGLLLISLVFGPWAFGTTQRWSIQTMNFVGATLWVLLAARYLLVRRESRWRGGNEMELGGATRAPLGAERLFTRLLAIATFLILGYCLASAWNARATYRPESWSFTYHASLRWLPHSYDSESSWRLLWSYVGIAGIFWAARVWILGSPDPRVAVPSPGQVLGSSQPPLPSRLRLLLWVLSLNAAFLGFEAIIQRAVGANRLLGLVETRINNEAISQFGPYAYRSNAAQYFNLVWPVTLGLWLSCQRARRIGAFVGAPGPRNHHHLLISCAIVAAVCPVVSTSRGGALVMGLMTVLAGAVMLLARWKSTWGAKLAMLLLLGGMLGGGALLGWEELAPRMEVLRQGLDEREAICATGRRMAYDNPLFGTGPGSFNHLFQLYRSSPNEYWPAQLHNDWLETLITFGWAGSLLLAGGLFTALARWFFAGRRVADKYFMMFIWISLAGCLVHARFDFPFQIHSILTLFMVLCAAASCLSRTSEI